MSSIIATPVRVMRAILAEPIITGPLLLLLLRGPPQVRQTLTELFTSARIPGDPAVNIQRTIKALKWLFAIGATSTVNRMLNSLAVHNWSLSKQGEPWNFKDGREIILITGGSSGFGLLMAKRFSGKGKIVLIDVSPLPKELESIPNLKYYKCDLSNFDEVRATAAAIKSEVGNPSVLINNAGIAKDNPILNSTPEWIEKIFKVNLISHWQLCQEFVPAMLKAKKGHVVEMASVASFVGVPCMVDYCAVKTGVLAFYEGLSAELSAVYENGRCIRTSSVHPTWARTGIIAGYEDRLKSAGQTIIDPAVVADKVVEQVLANRSGQILIPDEVRTLSTIRAWPTWMQHLVRNYSAKMASSTGNKAPIR